MAAAIKGSKVHRITPGERGGSEGGREKNTGEEKRREMHRRLYTVSSRNQLEGSRIG